MSAQRWLLALLFFASLLTGLVACSSNTAGLDVLTQVQPSNTRERAMRRLNLATAYYEHNQNEVALQEVRAALDIDPTYADAYSLLGLIHQRGQMPELAHKSFEQALQLASQSRADNANFAAIAHNYGWFLCEQNHFELAQAKFEQALLQPGYRETHKTKQALELCQRRAQHKGARAL